MEENFAFVGAKINYNLPLVRNLLYLRAGIGAGVGFHKTTDYFMGDTPLPAPPLDKFVKSHGMIDLYLTFRVSKMMELRVSPLIVSPSQMIFGSKFDVPYENTSYIYWNPLGTLGITVRF